MKEDKIIKTYVEGDIVDLKKGIFGYRVIHPVKNPDGSRNKINLFIGGWGNFWALIFILLVVMCFFYGVNQMLISCKELAADPCASCQAYLDEHAYEDYGGPADAMRLNMGLNISKKMDDNNGR